MNPEQLTHGLLTYVVFLFSTTCHEAAHAWVALLGGDRTAFDGGQVSLNPLPHIRREPFGMVVLPLLSVFMGSGMIGWASAPYNPAWQRLYPRRAAMMSLAGPMANFALALIAGVLLRLGVGSQTEGVGAILNIFFGLNVLLGVFNLLPFPPFDGFGVLGFFTGHSEALENIRASMRQYSIIGLIIGWRLIEFVVPPVEDFAVRLIMLIPAR